jgi:uncharacterized protein YjbI with pentapeptide repeats
MDAGDRRGASNGLLRRWLLLIARLEYQNTDLRYARFFGTDLRSANFNNADLRGATFDSAVIKGADFAGADVTGATFTHEALSEAKDLRQQQPSRTS